MKKFVSTSPIYTFCEKKFKKILVGIFLYKKKLFSGEKWFRIEGQNKFFPNLGTNFSTTYLVEAILLSDSNLER